MSEPWFAALRRKFGWWSRELRFRWKFRHQPEVVATISPHPAPHATVERLRRRVISGDWTNARSAEDSWSAALRRTAEAQQHSSADAHGVSVKPSQLLVLLEIAEAAERFLDLDYGYLAGDGTQPIDALAKATSRARHSNSPSERRPVSAEPRGPTTEELRARVLAATERARESADVIDGHADALADLGAEHGATAAHGIARRIRDDAVALEAEARDALHDCGPRPEGRTFYDPARPPLDSEGAERQ